MVKTHAPDLDSQGTALKLYMIKNKNTATVRHGPFSQIMISWILTHEFR